MIRTAYILALTAALATAIAGPAEARAKRLPKVGGTEAGPIIGGMVANNGYYAYGPYYAPGFVGVSGLYGPALPVAPGCYLQRQRIWTTFGWVWRQAPICY